MHLPLSVFKHLVNACPLLHAGEPCALVQTIKCDEVFVCTGFIVHFKRSTVLMFRQTLY